MILAVLEVGAFLILGLIIFVFSSMSRSTGSATQKERLRRIEDKLNFLMELLGAEYVPRDKERWQRLADNNQPEEAAKDYAEQHSIEEEEATKVVEQYMADARRSDSA